MNQTFQNSAQVLSIGIFFTLMIVGLAATLPHAMTQRARGARRRRGHRASTSAHLPPVSILFAAFLGYNPIQHLLGPHALAAARRRDRAALTGRSFFPHLISGPFRTGLHAAFAFAIVACLIAAAASLLRGGRYQHGEAERARGEDSRAGQAIHPTNGGAACALSGTASRRSASRPTATVVVDRPVRRHLGPRGARACSSSTRRSTA